MLLITSAARAAGEEQGPLGMAPATPATIFSPDEVIVEWESGTGHADRVDARESAEVDSVTMLGAAEFQLARLEEGQSMGDALKVLRDDPAVRVASRNSYSAPNSIPNDPLFGELWGLRNLGTGIDGFSGAVAGADIDAPAAWDSTVGSPSVVIADLDSGYRFDSPDLAPVAWDNPADPPGGGDNDGNEIVDDSHGADFVGPSVNSPAIDGNPTDDNLIEGGHGVHTAGTMGAAGNDGIGITGVAQNVRIMPLRICSYFTDPTPSPEDDSGTVCPTDRQIMAINYAGSHGARVANMSLGGTTANNAVRDALAKNPQTLFVISAGNDGPLATNADNDIKPHYPCNYDPSTSGIPDAIDNVICVAATDQADHLANFSDWGATSVDLGAPGTETLSTYPITEDKFSDDFETDDFAATWSNSGTESFGRAGPGDGPLTSFGMNDSPGSTPTANSTHIVTATTTGPLPAGTGACRLSAMRYRSGGSGGSFFYEILSDGSRAFLNTGSTTTGGSSLVSFRTAPITGLGGHVVGARFGFTAGPSPTASNGIWLDDVKLTCNAPLSTPPGYEFLQGTSMAAPHVTGAAGLLFSQKPSASVTEVREALLAGVDLIPSLAAKTVTGGRLNVATAIDVLEGEEPVDEEPPAPPQLKSTSPVSPADENHPKIVGTTEPGSTVEIYSGTTCGGSPVATGDSEELKAPGIAVTVPDNSTSQFSATATDAALNTSSCSDPISYTEKSVEIIVDELPPGTVRETEEAIRKASPPSLIQLPTLTCTVPKLSGQTLGQAKKALAKAGCKLGKVTKPKGRKLPPLVVKSSAPAAGAKPASGKVDLTLGPKPKPKKHRH
jgi:subtilisin family serine protease